MEAIRFAKLFSSETFVTGLGLIVGVFVSRIFGIDAKGAVATLAAIVGLSAALSSLGVSNSAVKLAAENANKLMIAFSLVSAAIGVAGIFIYSTKYPIQFHFGEHVLELYLILFLTIYNLQSLAFILSRKSRKYYPLAITFGQISALIVLVFMYAAEHFNAIWLTFFMAFGQFLISYSYMTSIREPKPNVGLGSLTEYVRNSLTQAPIIYITAISIHIPALVLSSTSLAEVGLYSVAATSVLITGKIPRLLHGMTMGGEMFNSGAALRDLFKIQMALIVLVAALHILLPYLIPAIYGVEFTGAVPVALVLLYSTIPLVYLSFVEAKLIVLEYYQAIIFYKFLACCFLISLLFLLPSAGFQINAELMAWSVLAYRYFSLGILFLAVKSLSVDVLS